MQRELKSGYYVFEANMRPIAGSLEDMGYQFSFVHDKAVKIIPMWQDATQPEYDPDRGAGNAWRGLKWGFFLVADDTLMARPMDVRNAAKAQYHAERLRTANAEDAASIKAMLEQTSSDV